MDSAQDVYQKENEKEREVVDYLAVAIGVVLCIFTLSFVFLAGTWYAEAKMNKLLVRQGVK